MHEHAAHLSTRLDLPSGESVELLMPLTVWTDANIMAGILRVLGAEPFPSEKAWFDELADIVDRSERVS